MQEFLPNIDPQIFTLSASIVGYAITPYFSIDELNSIGNWLMSVGQYLETVSVQATLIQNRVKKNQSARNQAATSNDFEVLYRAIQRLQAEVENFQKNYQ